MSVIHDGRNRPEQRVLPDLRVMADIHQSTLSNGLRVAIEPDGTVPIVGVSLSYDVGSRVEVPGEAGFAHLFEHMMFQGSAHVPKDGFVSAIQGHGGDVNGSTGVERTTFYRDFYENHPNQGCVERDSVKARSNEEVEAYRKEANVVFEFVSEGRPTRRPLQKWDDTTFPQWVMEIVGEHRYVDPYVCSNSTLERIFF